MKILTLSNLYPPDFIGGYELACAHVVDAFRERGHDVRVLTATPRQPIPRSPEHVLRRFRLVDEWSEDGMGSASLAYRLDEAESRLVSAHNVHVLTSVLDEFAPDVVYICCVTGLGGFALVACLQYMKIPWVWQLGDRVPFHLCSTRETVIEGLARAFSSRIRGNYIVVSEQLRREIEDAGIHLNGRVQVLPNWITGTRRMVERSYYKGGHLRIMSAGQVARWKGSDLLIVAAANLRELGHDDFSIDFYGRVHQPDLVLLASKLGLTRHVSFKGVLPHRQLLDAYRDYDVFAFPTILREPFGLVPLEAMARGCVPVLTRKCGIAEYLVHGVHGLKAERDAHSFARAFAAVMRGEVDLEAMGRRGMVMAWRDFHIDSILPSIERQLVQASLQSRAGAGTAKEAYRLARLAEQVGANLIQETIVA
ncbi:glycosyltransferase family 4 protein [Singulisphaera sp. PoT]|uniref:glycosyltransferase family 4 protein n=1 Tax=Singulisphaera sp. PoT TaxID=3411797 RepID=UPI003BF48195